MEKFILQQIALDLVSKIKEINTTIKELEYKLNFYKSDKISNKSKTFEINQINQTISEKMKTIVNLAESKFILPDKLVDNILILYIKLLDLLFTNLECEYDKKIISNEILPSISKFLQIEQNYTNGMSRSEFITRKWKILENILKYSLAMIDFYEKEKNSMDSSEISSIFNLIQLIYFNLDSDESKYNIMPGLISKILKVLNFASLEVKIPNKIFRIFMKILKENSRIIFKNLDLNFPSNSSLDKNIDPLKLKNFLTFFEFYMAFHIKLQESFTKDKLEKFLPELIEMNSNSVKELHNLKLKAESLGLVEKSNFESTRINFKKVFYFICRLVNLESLESAEILIDEEFFSSFLVLFKEQEILSELNRETQAISNMINKNELNLSKDAIRSHYIHLNLYLIKIFSNNKTDNKIPINNFTDNMLTYQNIFNDDNNNNLLVLEPLKIFFEEILLKIFELKRMLILEAVNAYEIQVNNFSAFSALENYIKKMDQFLNHGQENEFKILISIMKSVFNSYPIVKKYFLNLCLEKLNSATRNLRKLLAREDLMQDKSSLEDMKVNVKEFQTNFDKILQILSLFVEISHIPINITIKKSQSSDDFTKKQKIILKNILNFYSSVFVEIQELMAVNSINKCKISLMNSLLMVMYGYLLNLGKKEKSLFTNHELNNILIFSLPNYCNRAGILKYSSIYLICIMIDYKASCEEPDNQNEIGYTNLNFKNFIFANFDFIINTTIKKIIYFDLNQNQKEMKSQKDKKKSMNKNFSALSNFKLDILNLFNSLIFLLKEFKNEDFLNFYCGEFNKFIKKLFGYLETFIKEKNFFSVECLLEIVEKITLLQKEVIEKNYESFKLNHYEDFVVSEMDKDSEKFMGFLKERVSLDDSNLFRNLILRILPLFFSNKIGILFKCIKIFENLVPVLFLLPMSREEKKNFSTEDNSNVLVKSSLGPVMFEAWGYFIFILQIKNSGSINTNNIMNQNINFFGNIFNFFLKVAEYYPKFFNETRIFSELMTIISDNINLLSKSFNQIQISKAVMPSIIFIQKIIEINFYELEDIKEESKRNLLNYAKIVSELSLVDVNSNRENTIQLSEFKEKVNWILDKLEKISSNSNICLGNNIKEVKEMLQ